MGALCPRFPRNSNTSQASQGGRRQSTRVVDSLILTISSETTNAAK